jgi:uncharacterized delta-60 repeat protein
MKLLLFRADALGSRSVGVSLLALLVVLPAAAQSNFVDLSFNAGGGPGDTVKCIAPQPDGRIVIGGFFFSVAGTNTSQIARLNANGSLDAAFLGRVDNTVRAVLIQPDGRIVLGGGFANVNLTPRTQVARVLPDGSLDAGFVPPTLAAPGGGDANIFALARQADGKVLAGGLVASTNGMNNAGVVRLNTNGTLDTTFNTGAGANGGSPPVHTLAVQSDQRIIVAGQFTSFNGGSRPGIVRLLTNGSIDGTYVLDLRNSSTITAAAMDGSDRMIVSGDLRLQGSGGMNSLPVPQRLLSSGAIDTSFNIGTGANGSVEIIAIDSAGGIVIGGFFTSVNGVPRNGIARLLPSGAVDPSFGGTSSVPFFEALAIQADRRILIGGNFDSVAGVARTNIARLNRSGPGVLRFGALGTTAVESDGTIAVNVVRTNGDVGTVTVDYSTTSGTATAGADFVATSGTLTFADGVTNQTLMVTLVDDANYENPESFLITISNATGGATISGFPNHSVSVTDDQPPPSTLEFDAAAYSFQENAGRALLTVLRTGSTNPVTVSFATTNGTALAGSDYVATNGTLSFGPADTFKRIEVPLLDSFAVEGDETFTIRLFNPVGAGFGAASNAAVTILDSANSPEELYGHGLVILTNTLIGFTNVPTVTFSSSLMISNPAPSPSSNGFVQLTVIKDGFPTNAITNLFLFGALPAGATTNVMVSGTVPVTVNINDPTNKTFVYATVFEQLALTNAPQDSAQILMVNGTAPPSGGVPVGGGGLDAPGFAPPPVVTNVIVLGTNRVEEGTFADYTAMALLSNGTTNSAITPVWTNSPFLLSAAGRFTPGGVTADTRTVVTGVVTYGATVMGTSSVLVVDVREPSFGPPSLAGNQATLQLQGTTGRRYVLETRTNLSSPSNWTVLATNQILSNSLLPFVDPSAGTNAQRFYRARQVP